MKGWVYVLMIAGILCGCASSKAPPVTILPAPSVTSEKAAPFMADGDRLASSKDWAAAAQSYERATAAQPELAEAHYNLAVCLDHMGERAKARKHYVTAANLAPGNKVIWDSPPLRETGSTYNLDKKTYLDPSPRSGF